MESKEIRPEEPPPASEEKTLPPTWREALTRLVPKDPYTLIASIGVLAGIAYYASSQNPWLLLTFISLLFGRSAVDQLRHRP
jgi:hypothetical protein